MPEIFTVPIFINQTIAANGNVSKQIYLNNFKPGGNDATFRIHLAGSGASVNFTAKFSHDGSNFFDVTGKTSIKSSMAPGDDMVEFTLAVAPYIEITATETAGNAVTDLDMTMALK